MRRFVLAVALVIAASTAAQADCKDEVATALERQRKSSTFRMETTMISEEGKVNMTVDYMLPDRMRQVLTSAGDPNPIETIVIGEMAWTRRGGGDWELVHPQVRAALVRQMEETLGDNPGELGEFACLGRKAVAGKNMLAYQGENEKAGPKDLSRGVKDMPKAPDRPVRIIYVDAITGLPMRSLFARANSLDKPIFEATYSYPADIRIEAPPPPTGQ